MIATQRYLQRVYGLFLIGLTGLLSLPSWLPADDTAVFESIFNGQDLRGWQPADASYWSVEDGAITGRISPEHPCAINQYLVWQGGDLADFELKLKSRLEGEGGINNGFQFRSRRLPDGDICGYQVDNNLQTPWLVRLYDEFGRHTLAMRGTRTTFERDGRSHAETIDEANGDAWFRLEDWHEYHLVCVGPKMTLRVDGRLAAEVIDHDWRRSEAAGVLALQLHSGPPTRVQFKDIRLLQLSSDTRANSGVSASPTDADKVRLPMRSTAIAWWRFDDGAHGAIPPLRHVPGWEQFEMNVRPDGIGAGTRPVLLLNGAHFESNDDLVSPQTALTAYLRMRNTEDRWNSMLMYRAAEPTGPLLEWFSTQDERAAQLHFRLHTGTHEPLIATAPLRDVDLTAWHDWVARYDGQQISLFCDGRQMTTAAATGPLAAAKGPLWIGAAPEADADHRPTLHGELEEAALWTRPLSDEEIRLLHVEVDPAQSAPR